MSINKVRVLVTGATGFVGQNLVPYLTGLGFDVVTVGRTGCKWSYEDMRDNPAVRGSVIVHLAGRAHDTSGVTSADEYDSVNVKLAARVYEDSKLGGAAKFIFVSSIKAVADELGEVVDEATPPRPTSPYGVSKLKAEDLLNALAAVGGEMDLFILRPVVINDPGVKGNVSLLARCAKMGVPYPFSSFANKRSMLAVDNLSYVIARMCSDPIVPATYIVADDESLSSQGLFEILCEEFGRSARSFRFPPSLIQLGARVGSLLNLPLNTSNIEKLLGTFEVSNLALLSALGLERLPYTVSDGVRSCVSSRKIQLSSRE